MARDDVDFRLLSTDRQRAALAENPDLIGCVTGVSLDEEGTLRLVVQHGPSSTEVPNLPASAAMLSGFALWFSVARGILGDRDLGALQDAYPSHALAFPPLPSSKEGIKKVMQPSCALDITPLPQHSGDHSTDAPGEIPTPHKRPPCSEGEAAHL